MGKYWSDEIPFSYVICSVIHAFTTQNQPIAIFLVFYYLKPWKKYTKTLKLESAFSEGSQFRGTILRKYKFNYGGISELIRNSKAVT